eukprot:NODE_33004_length_319_cov_5.828125.p2 GENE.NODE_33004_length_319_cov_5.828125~~NODE_33004_length_319_cov_5.828125.p2  ORF type:complete len:51 (-),score=24.71 NODE_33004_length_319_cov_5.828125:79-231(-)
MRRSESPAPLNVAQDILSSCLDTAGFTGATGTKKKKKKKKKKKTSVKNNN